MSFVRIPIVPIVPAEATERLQKKFTAAKAEKVREAFWKKVQDSKQPRAS